MGLFQTQGDWQFAESVMSSLQAIAKELKRANDLKEAELQKEDFLVAAYRSMQSRAEESWDNEEDDTEEDYPDDDQWRIEIGFNPYIGSYDWDC